jgi:ectoine hydroxylase-related dioxygenase (phytanoyl-CoA dioxygenase family)
MQHELPPLEAGPRRQAGVIRPPVVELTAENTDQVVVSVRSGTLLIFPSWLEHSVDANPNEAERISVSFNVMLSSFTEQLSQPLWSGERSS